MIRFLLPFGFLLASLGCAHALDKDAPWNVQDEEFIALSHECLSLSQKKLYDRAIQARQDLIKMAERKWGPDHYKVGCAVFQLAVLYHMDKKEYPEAEKLYRRGMVIIEKSVGKEDDMYFQHLIGLAYLYRQTERPTEAEKIEKLLSELREKKRSNKPKSR